MSASYISSQLVSVANPRETCYSILWNQWNEIRFWIAFSSRDFQHPVNLVSIECPRLGVCGFRWESILDMSFVGHFTPCNTQSCGQDDGWTGAFHCRFYVFSHYSLELLFRFSLPSWLVLVVVRACSEQEAGKLGENWFVSGESVFCLHSFNTKLF